MNKKTYQITLGFLLAAVTLYAKAIPLAEIPFSHWQKSAGYYTSFSFILSYVDGPPSSAGLIEEVPGTTIFDSILLTPSDSGKQYSLSTNLDDPELGMFTQFLTNGQDNQFKYYYRTNYAGGSFGYKTESTVYSDFLGVDQVDFTGFTIDSITLNVNSLTMKRVFTSPCRTNVGCTEVSFDGSVIIEGYANSVPEPSNLALISVGLLMLTAMARRRRLCSQNHGS